MLKDSALPASARYDSLVDRGHSARVHPNCRIRHIDIACNFSDTTVCLTARTVPAVNQTVVSGRNENRSTFETENLYIVSPNPCG